jgi:recombination protein RecA
MREKIGVMFGNPETTGGNALKFYASVRLDIRRSTQIKDGDSVLGNRTKVKVVKKQVAPLSKLQNLTLCTVKEFQNRGDIRSCR